MVERLVPLDSPLTRYMAEMGEPVSSISIEKSSLVKKSHFLGSMVDAVVGVFSFECVLQRTHRFNSVYQQIVQCQDAKLQEDFPDIASACRENQVPVVMSREDLYSTILCCISLFCLYHFISGWSSWFFCSLALVAFFVWERKTARRPVALLCVSRVHLDEFIKHFRLSLNLLREVELVWRGFRIGPTIQSPISLMERLDASHGQKKQLVWLRASCVDALRSVCDACVTLIEACKTSHVAVLTSDVVLMTNQLKDLSLEDDSIAYLSNHLNLISNSCFNAFVLSLRCVIHMPSHQEIVQQSLNDLQLCLERHKDRLKDARRVDWREQSADLKSEEDAQKKPKSSRALATLKSGVRTIGAKSVLLQDLPVDSEESKRFREEIRRDLESLLSDWTLLMSEDESNGKSKQDVDSSHPGYRFRKEDVEHNVTQMGALGEVDVIGGSNNVARDENTLLRHMESLQEVLELKLAESESEEASSRRPKLSREERIEQMRKKKEAEEVARSESMAMYALMGELENVLSNRKRFA